jgi:hypothetical protein
VIVFLVPRSLRLLVTLSARSDEETAFTFGQSLRGSRGVMARELSSFKLTVSLTAF